VQLVGFIRRNFSRCTVTWTSKSFITILIIGRPWIPLGDFTPDPPMLFLYDKVNITLPHKPSLPSTFLPFRFFWQQFSMRVCLLFIFHVCATYLCRHTIPWLDWCLYFREFCVLFFLHNVQTSSGAQPAPCSTGTGVLFLG